MSPCIYQLGINKRPEMLLDLLVPSITLTSPLRMKWAIQPSFSALSSSGIFPLYFSVLVVFKLTFGGSDLRSKTSLTEDNSDLGCHRLDLSLNKRQGVSSQFDSNRENGGYMPQNFLTPCFI